LLTILEGSIIELSFTLGFSVSNNKVEYEAILVGLEWLSRSEPLNLKFDVIPH